jgi:hypothetical protein
MELSLLEKQQVVHLPKKFLAFMEPKGSLPYLQEPSNGPYPELDESSPLHLGFSSGLFPSGFHTNFLYAFIFAKIRAT